MTDPLYPLESAMVRGDETRGIPVASAQGFAADMCRDKKALCLHDGKRPSVPCERHDIEHGLWLGRGQGEQIVVGTESKAQIVSGKLLPLNLVSRRGTPKC
jgi:hypothetical protein